MEREFLDECLAEGLSLASIAALVGRHPSTVGYWLRKYGLSAHKAKEHAPKGKLHRSDLEALVQSGLTLREIATRLERSPTTVRYWINKYELRVRRAPRQPVPGAMRKAVFECHRHGKTTFVLEARGYYRCSRCRAEAVAKRRRAIKRKLVEEAGGQCAVCGYSRSQHALQFHHLDPAAKEFHLGQGGLTRSLAKLRVEAKKCILLCANCHAEVEAGLTEVPLNSMTKI